MIFSESDEVALDRLMSVARRNNVSFLKYESVEFHLQPLTPDTTDPQTKMPLVALKDQMSADDALYWSAGVDSPSEQTPNASDAVTEPHGQG